MGWLFVLKRFHPWVWLMRFRHRRGYGVHSPFAFHLITAVIYETTPYYKFKDLNVQQRLLKREKGHAWAYAETAKVKRMLFRLVNWAKPACIVDVGPDSAAELYLKGARTKAAFLKLDEEKAVRWDEKQQVDFLYLHGMFSVDKLWAVFDRMANSAVQQSVFVIEGIGYSSGMGILWKRIKQDERTGVSFDLYDLGIVCFDRTRFKQHYIVNF